jgi:hydroxyacyl-ACP dehydratase HTD2-like protein with hotdog domain
MSVSLNRLRPQNLVVGAQITPQVFRPTHVQLFRFSAATWNPHRIHYDRPYAQDEGYPDVLVQSHLHACYLAQTVCEWAGPDARLLRFEWQNRAIAMPGDVLTCTGEVVAVDEWNGQIRATCSLTETNQGGVVCAPGRAALTWPREFEEEAHV